MTEQTEAPVDYVITEQTEATASYDMQRVCSLSEEDYLIETLEKNLKWDSYVAVIEPLEDKNDYL